MSIGPSMPLRLEKPEGIDLAQAARYFGARGGADAATQALLEKCAVPLLAAATPRAVWLEADPDSLTAAGILAGEDVAKHLEGCTAALLLAVTLGPGVDAQIRRAGVGDIAAGVASDALGSALAEQAAEAAEAELRQWAARQGKYLTGRYSPGYGDWPLAVQPLLAEALDTARQLVGGSAKGIGVDDAAACGGIPGMDALDERRVGDVQLLGAGPQFQARCLQHGAHAAIHQDGIGPVKQFIPLHR